MIDGKHTQGTHSIKIGADKSAENTPNDQKLICPNCLPKPKSLGFRWKRLHLGVRSPWFHQSQIRNSLKEYFSSGKRKLRKKIGPIRGLFSFSTEKNPRKKFVKSSDEIVTCYIKKNKTVFTLKTLTKIKAATHEM